MNNILSFANFINENYTDSYWRTILTSMVKNKEELVTNKEEIIENMIKRAKQNLDSNPNQTKLDKWKEEIIKTIDRYIETDGKFEPQEGDFNYVNPIKKYNADIIKGLLKQGSYLYNEIQDLTDYYIKEVGYDNVVKYIEKEEKMQFFKYGEDFNVKRLPGENILHFVQRKERIQRQLIKNKLIIFFMKRLQSNIPGDRKYTEKEMEKFVSIYIEKFLHLYLLPIISN